MTASTKLWGPWALLDLIGVLAGALSRDMARH